MDNLELYINKFSESLLNFFPSLIKAIGILIIGLLIIKLSRRLFSRLMNRKQMDPTALKFFLDLFTWVFRVLLIITVIGQLGVPTSSFVAAIGAAGLAVGLSLQGSLSNFAGGLLIIIFKPFRVGDAIEAQGESGTVSAIRIFNTKIITGNNQVIYLPNGSLSNGTIRNFSKEPIRRADITLAVAYETDLRAAKEIIKQVIATDPKILHDPSPVVQVKDLGENAVNVQVLLWSANADYGTMVAEFYENIKYAFDGAKMHIPYPQRDIHILEGNKDAVSAT